jgi:hypothetical protein
MSWVVPNGYQVVPEGERIPQGALVQAIGCDGCWEAVPECAVGLLYKGMARVVVRPVGGRSEVLTWRLVSGLERPDADELVLVLRRDGEVVPGCFQGGASWCLEPGDWFSSKSVDEAEIEAWAAWPRGGVV